MSTAVVALIVGLVGAAISLVSAIATWRKDKATIRHDDKALGLDQLRLALDMQDLQIKRLLAETHDQAKRIDELEDEIGQLRVEVQDCHMERDLLKRQLAALGGGP